MQRTVSESYERRLLGTLVAGAGTLLLAGCGGLAVDGPAALDPDVRAEPLPERFADCDALLRYTREQAQGMIASAPTGTPFPPLLPQLGVPGFETPSYAEWPGAKQQAGAGRLARVAGPQSDVEDFYALAPDALLSLSKSPRNVGGSNYPMPGPLASAVAGGKAWVFANARRALVVGSVELAAMADLPWPQGEVFGAAPSVSHAGGGTYFWELELGSQTPTVQRLRYVDALLLGARSAGDSVQVLLRAERPSRLDLWSTPADAPLDAAQLEQRRAHNRSVVDAASAGDWLPQFVDSELPDGAAEQLGDSQPALGCSDLYAPATPSGLNLLTWVALDLTRGLSSWQAGGLYTGDVQVFESEQRWAFVTEPWWALSEGAARSQGHSSPETILHTFAGPSAQLEPRGSVAVRGAALHEQPGANAGDQWFLASHAKYGPGLGAQDEGRIWSFRAGRAALDLLGSSPSFPVSERLRTDFVTGAAYVHAALEAFDAELNVRIDLSDPTAPSLSEGPTGDFRVVPWTNGQHLLFNARQIRVLSGSRELAQFAQGFEPSQPGYADAQAGLLVDVQGNADRNRRMRFQRFDGIDPPRDTGTVRFRTGALFPPLIEEGEILSVYAYPTVEGSAYGIEVLDANTLAPLGALSGN